MSISEIKRQAIVGTQVLVTDDMLTVNLADGRIIAVPLDWYPRLAHATKKERKTWRFIGGGRGIHWPDIDEDISVINLLAGQPSAESPSSLRQWLGARNGKSQRS